ncbi:GNAT family N-acetyltransferase [Streptomyces sp. NPDC059373]
MSVVTVRSATEGDAEAVFGLLGAFVTSHRPRRDAFDRHFPLLGDGLLVAEAEEGQVVGYALVCDLLVLYANGYVCELQELMVDPACRGRGIGERLVAAVLERARAKGAVEVTVPTRRARDYYLRLGFEETATYLKRPVRDQEKKRTSG